MDKCIFCNQILNAFNTIEKSFKCASCGPYVLANGVFEFLTENTEQSQDHKDMHTLKTYLACYLAEQKKQYKGRVYVLLNKTDSRKYPNSIVIGDALAELHK